MPGFWREGFSARRWAYSSVAWTGSALARPVAYQDRTLRSSSRAAPVPPNSMQLSSMSAKPESQEKASAGRKGLALGLSGWVSQVRASRGRPRSRSS